MTELAQLTDDQIQKLPIDRLALVVLQHCDERGEWSTHNFLNSAQHRGVRPASLYCLGAAGTHRP